MEATHEGIEKIADSKILDIVSLGIDQDAQENFFHPEKQDVRRTGAGGVPVRSPQDYRNLFNASQRGNFPLMRTYSGTDDFLELAQMYIDTIHIAWPAIPLLWFNQMDGRGPWDLVGSIREHQKVMAFYGGRGFPLEVNEPHHWGMRDAPDVIFVVSAYLSAYNARAFGVRDYIAQMMFNSPPGTSDTMDLAKMSAALTLSEELESDTFRIWRQTRTGLLSYPLEPNAAMAHLAASVYVQMALRPHILHVVGHTEAHHAATADDIIDACQMARRSIENALKGQPDMLKDPAIQQRKVDLVREARITLTAINNSSKINSADPFTDPECLAGAVSSGILDAPHLKNNPFALGTIQTRIINGASEVVDGNGSKITEAQRLKKFL